MEKLITREEATGMFQRYGATPEEADRLLVADETERRVIWLGIQDRLARQPTRQQNKWAPMGPREGPPLPRLFTGLRWPWRRD